ncbi:MAG: hypothetical protein Q7V15_08860 [Phenylobacterium sp.]|uniref:hypothetical protein n=1 Tax=Phenylobacterium sp. TaxID=1871053 RepID=UPI00271626E6|nr:hypothetical protein [Phenylobacterium sp.]MDO8901450.1 hypothetical protein [Phenylobacterium sp.]MDP2215204.1 hypothetical protein [Phenylobacterium sp.]
MMDLDRFAALAEAYGGDVSRWPADEREDATLLMSTTPEAAATVLARESDLDWALDAWRVPAASANLQAAILACAPAERAPPWRGWLWRTSLGAGLMAAGVAGVMAGVVVSGAVAPIGELEVITAAVSAYDTLDVDLVGDV